MNIFALAGHVGQAASEYRGSNQAALAMTTGRLADRIVHYPDSYNVPLHLMASEEGINSNWLALHPVHLHYHQALGQRHQEVVLKIHEKPDVTAECREWLAQRISHAGHL